MNSNPLIQLIAGPPPPWTVGYDRIHTVLGAILWRTGSLPGLDATVRADGSVRLFRRRGGRSLR